MKAVEEGPHPRSRDSSDKSVSQDSDKVKPEPKDMQPLVFSSHQDVLSQSKED